VSQIDLGFNPGNFSLPLKGLDIMIAVGQTQNLFLRLSVTRGEGNLNLCIYRNPDLDAQTQNGI
jgi:hypothetical protein